EIGLVPQLKDNIQKDGQDIDTGEYLTGINSNHLQSMQQLKQYQQITQLPTFPFNFNIGSQCRGQKKVRAIGNALNNANVNMVNKDKYGLIATLDHKSVQIRIVSHSTQIEKAS
ncbi:MAG: hypothetical protein EZS28_019709, partial [Streblomastix strix]